MLLHLYCIALIKHVALKVLFTIFMHILMIRYFLDVEHQDMRQSRAAAFNIIPTTTGARNVIVSYSSSCRFY